MKGQGGVKYGVGGPYTSRYASREEIPKFKMSEKGVSAETTHQLLKDELDLDGRPNLNLAR